MMKDYVTFDKNGALDAWQKRNLIWSSLVGELALSKN